MRHCRKAEVPEKQKTIKAFYLLHNLAGHIGQAELSYIIRDHDQTLFQKRKEKMVQIIEKLNEYYGERITYQLYDQYYNMGDRIKENPQSVIIARQAMKDLGSHRSKPLSRRHRWVQNHLQRIPTPNLFTGGENFHGQYEFITVEAMAKARDLIVAIVKRVAE